MAWASGGDGRPRSGAEELGTPPAGHPRPAARLEGSGAGRQPLAVAFAPGRGLQLIARSSPAGRPLWRTASPSGPVWPTMWLWPRCRFCRRPHRSALALRTRSLCTTSCRTPPFLRLAKSVPTSLATPFVVASPGTGDEVSVVFYAQGHEDAMSWQRICNVLGRQDGFIAVDCVWAMALPARRCRPQAITGRGSCRSFRRAQGTGTEPSPAGWSFQPSQPTTRRGRPWAYPKARPSQRRICPESGGPVSEPMATTPGRAL